MSLQKKEISNPPTKKMKHANKNQEKKENEINNVKTNVKFNNGKFNYFESKKGI